MSAHSLKTIQALRGIAAIIVVLFHYKWQLNLDLDNRWVSAVFNSGGLGVTIFFILSGFIMVYSGQSKSSAINFVVNRFSRIYPAYLFFIILGFAIGGAMSTFHYDDKTLNFIRSFMFMPATMEYAPAYIDVNSITGVRWTLNYEMYFYALMALSFIFRRKMIALFMMFTVALIIIPICSGFTPTLGVEGYPYKSEFLGFITNPIMYEFILGVSIALLYAKFKNVPAVISLPLLIVALSVVAYGCFYHGINDHGLKSSALFMALLFAALVFNAKWLDNYIPGVLFYLGEISFSVYLLHNPVMHLVKKYLLHSEKGLAVFIAASLLTLILSHLSYKYFERKGSTALKNYLLAKVGRNELRAAEI
ncbi:peptidoglycan/LPS O-acetylase OafA/YrhL [Enterobacter sp. BIGb0383]|uniref:acyltransferase family protein n=1 Tax=unclassified Enterobacter TaxID=2608935 RepID=UPI000F4AD64F|nr:MULTISPECIES: acyltransferase [unclassified Enterobacter]ROP62660.1 peptidoglycan/LPS O-acetylase OafA/YrhL [Enterobacter sp. BIGb0383]ROS12821.1 peptidoglycan/LPS O-acetylase OafA/YrhL [Enterobacter sp. BIGb0359]